MHFVLVIFWYTAKKEWINRKKSENGRERKITEKGKREGRREERKKERRMRKGRERIEEEKRRARGWGREMNAPQMLSSPPPRSLISLSCLSVSFIWVTGNASDNLEMIFVYSIFQPLQQSASLRITVCGPSALTIWPFETITANGRCFKVKWAEITLEEHNTLVHKSVLMMTS